MLHPTQAEPGIMNPPSIRRACKEDQDQVGALWLRLLTEHAVLDPRVAVADDALVRWSNDFPYAVAREQARIFVADQEGTLVGFISARLWTPLPIYAETTEGYIDELYVVPEARRQGVGARLVQAVKAWAAAVPAGQLRVGVLAANADGLAFWERMQAHPLAVTLTLEVAASDPAREVTHKTRLGF